MTDPYGYFYENGRKSPPSPSAANDQWYMGTTIPANSTGSESASNNFGWDQQQNFYAPPPPHQQGKVLLIFSL
jgi:hypothetical protein